MALHSTLTDPYLHEPKGASTASAGDVYVADGAGSGVWSPPPSGWGHYADNSADQTFTATPTKMVIDGAGAETTVARLPLEIRGVGNLWDTINNKITPIAAGDAYMCRLVFPITSVTTAKFLEVNLDTGGAATITDSKFEVDVNVVKPVPFDAEVSFPIYTEAGFVTNGGQLFLSVDAGSVVVAKPSILLSRIHAEV